MVARLRRGPLGKYQRRTTRPPALYLKLTLALSNDKIRKRRNRCSAPNPEHDQVGADLENGIYYGNETSNPDNMPLTYPFVLAMLKGGTDGFALKAGDATQAKLMSMFDGTRPSSKYQPMQKQGGLILGIGGDNSDGAIGSFFEGVVLSGYTTDAQDDALHRSVVAAGYGQ